MSSSVVVRINSIRRALNIATVDYEMNRKSCWCVAMIYRIFMIKKKQEEKIMKFISDYEH